ncbi:hypothetical protein F5146DRAFT_1125095 [Armillaria mellea]|nr:hypothetical protein F5146DRAFT_1125095 [Armillaria mellea]
MRMCGKCQYIRYCSEASVRNPIGVDTERIVAKSYASSMGALGSRYEHRWIFEWAALEALRVHATDDLLHSFLQLDVMYGDLARLGGRPEQTIFLYKASVTPFSEAPWLTGMEVDFKEAQEIRANGGTSRAFAFVCFRWERDGRMMAFPLRFDLTALADTWISTCISPGNPFFMVLSVNGFRWTNCRRTYCKQELRSRR